MVHCRWHINPLPDLMPVMVLSRHQELGRVVVVDAGEDIPLGTRRLILILAVRS